MTSPKTASQEPAPSTLAIWWGFPTARGRLSQLPSEPTLVGRGDSCKIQLPGKEISREHAEIRREGLLCVIKDLGSHNGLFVDGKQVQESPLSPGQVVRLGEWIGVVVQARSDRPESDPGFGVLAAHLAGGPALRPILDQAKLAAPSSLPIVILGETGTGKEGVARAIHHWSGRSGAFVAVNCAALVPALAEGELFGYRKGAFTGADRGNPGFFRAAQQGTLLLDEIADLPESVQPKLLRALEAREIVPLGESLPVSVDVRILAATQIPLAQLVAQGRFRPDLCARLAGLTVHLPPLRERRQEIPHLFLHLLRLHAGARPPEVEPRLVEQLCLYEWPFNVRELDLLARRLLVLHGHEPTLRRSHLPDEILHRATPHARHPSGSIPTPALPETDATGAAGNRPETHRARRERERALLRQALLVHKGNVAQASAAVGISRARAYRLMEDGDFVAAGREVDEAWPETGD